MANELYSAEELRSLGFSKVGKNVIISKDARFFAIEGELGDSVRIDSFAILTGKIVLGDRVHISPFSFLGGTGGTIRMENDSGVSTHVSIFTKSDDYTAHGQDKVCGSVTIGEGSIVGAGAKILPGVSVGKKSKIGSGCVVSQDIGDGAIIISRGSGLIPAR